MALVSALMTEITIPVCAVIGIVFFLLLWCPWSRNGENRNEQGDDERDCDEITEGISTGVNALVDDYLYAGLLMVAFLILIFLFLGCVERFSTQSRPFTFGPSDVWKPAPVIAISFPLGAFTSALSGFLGMNIVIRANARTGLMARNGSNAAFRSGAAMGFLLAAPSLLGLYVAIKLFKCYYGNELEGLFEVITGYSLGASSMAFFGRASGGIYAKAVDVYVDLINRNWPDYLKDRNLSVIPYNVGDIVGDIAGMGTDLFGSYAESSCAALVVASISPFGINHNFTAMCYPLLISSLGILFCLIPTAFTAYRSREVGDIGRTLRNQLVFSRILMIVGLAIVSWIALPSSFKIYNFGSEKLVTKWQLFSYVGAGLWAGPIFRFFTEHYPDAIRYLRDIFARNIAFVLASVYAVLAFVSKSNYANISLSESFSSDATYEIAVAALAMLSTMATRLAIDAYEPISHYAQRIARMACRGEFDPPGNPPAAIETGFAIESATAVSIALFGAFLTRAQISLVNFETPKVFSGLVVGYLLPYCFSAMTMKSVGRVGLQMAHRVNNARHANAPEYAICFNISNYEFLRGLILPGAIVMFTPVFVGTIFGVETLSGVLAGSLFSVLLIASPAFRIDGAWDQARRYIRAGALKYAKTHGRDDPWLLEYAEGEIFGNPHKDTSGPPLNILVQLMAVESLMFAPFFATHGGLLFKFL